MQVFAGHVERLAPADRDRIKARVPLGTWSDIASAGPLAWLPFEVNLACTYAVAECLGPERTDEFFRTLLLSTFKTSLLQGLVDAVMRKLGSDPGASLFWIARGFALMFEDCGVWRVIERKPKQASLQVLGVPFAATRDRIWVQSVASALGALNETARLPGTSRIQELDPKLGRVVFRLTW